MQAEPSGGPPIGSTRSRLFRGGGVKREVARGVVIAVVSTVVVLTLIVVFVTRSPYWSDFKFWFLNREIFLNSLPDILSKFRRNIFYFCIAEVFVLAFALLLAIMRSLRGPVFFPIRALAIAYTDLFRSFPTISSMA